MPTSETITACFALLEKHQPAAEPVAQYRLDPAARRRLAQAGLIRSRYTPPASRAKKADGRKLRKSRYLPIILKFEQRPRPYGELKRFAEKHGINQFAFCRALHAHRGRVAHKEAA